MRICCENCYGAVTPSSGKYLCLSGCGHVKGMVDGVEEQLFGFTEFLLVFYYTVLATGIICGLIYKFMPDQPKVHKFPILTMKDVDEVKYRNVSLNNEATEQLFDKIKIKKSEYTLLQVKALGFDAITDLMTKESDERRNRFNRLIQASTDFHSGKIDKTHYKKFCDEIIAEIDAKSTVNDRRTDQFVTIGF